MDEGKSIAYRYNIDKDKAYLYADKKCKQCNGKGYFVTQLPLGKSFRKNLPYQESPSYCSCFYKKRKKFL